MGVVIEFGVPMVRARRRNPGGYCEVTVFPGALSERRKDEGRKDMRPQPARDPDVSGLPAAPLAVQTLTQG